MLGISLSKNAIKIYGADFDSVFACFCSAKARFVHLIERLDILGDKTDYSLFRCV